MPTFNGETLIITLDPVVDGVLDVDVGIDLYTEWKTWAKQGNLRFPAAFRTTGGDELTAIINAGSYFFLRNDYGWRIKSYENDATYYIVGNLAVQDTSLPAFNPTDGAFTAAILGLQPVTQGVTPLMGVQLGNISFNNQVCLSVLGEAGTGIGASGDLIGTRQAPSNNMSDALSICELRGFNHINLTSDYTIVDEDLSAGYRLTGDSPFLILTVNPAADVTGCSLYHLTVQGEMDGLNLIEGCKLLNISSVSGLMHKIALAGNVTLSGDILVMESYSNWTGEGSTNWIVGSHTLEVRDFHGSFGVSGMTGGVHSVGITEGRLIIGADCTGGDIYLRGAQYEVERNDGNLVTLIDQTTSKKLDELHRLQGLDADNPMTVTPTARTAGNITQAITGDGLTTSTVTRT